MSNIYPLDDQQPHNPFDRGLVPIDQINQEEQLSDGSAVFNIGGKEGSEGAENRSDAAAFYRNLAEDLSTEKRSILAIKLLDEIKQDMASRSLWEKTINLALRYTGFQVEESRDIPFMHACSAFDSSLSTALLHFYSTGRAELFPAAGPARTEIMGSPTPEVEDQGERVKMFMNWYLTKKDKDYYPDSERLLMYVGLCGCAFRKVYQDPVLNRPVARLIRPQDFIVNNNTTSVSTSDRLTEVMFLSRKDVLLRQLSEDFIEFDLPKTADDQDDDVSEISKTVKKLEGIETDSGENKSLYKFYEAHVNLDVDDVEPKKKGEKRNTDIPRPYIVTICVTTRKIVSIRRNWKEPDNKFERIQHYVHYYYLPGFGIYGLGLAHLMGSNAITLTTIQRQLIDAATLKSFPGGLRMRGMRIEDNNRAAGPAEWLEVETGGMSLQECVMPMPYAEPSSVLLQLRQELKQETATMVSTAETEIPELGANMPVGTTLALLEVANKVQSSILRSLHGSLGIELQLLFDLFGEYLEETAYPFAVPGKEAAIMKKDFNDKVNIAPVSDPNVLTSTHRLMRNEALLKLAQSNPEIHDVREAYHRMYAAMNIDNIDKLLPPPPEPSSLDPVAENMLILSGKDVTVKVGQDDDSHIFIHEQFASNPLLQGNPTAYAQLLIHEQKHKCYKVYKEMYHEHKTKEIHEQLQQQMQQEMHQNMQMMMQQGMPQQLIEMQIQMHMPQAQHQMQQQAEHMIKQIPPPPELKPEQEAQMMQDPELQNRVAKNDMEKLQQELKQQAEAKEKELDPNKVMVMDIEQRREAAQLKDEADKLKAETEAFKAQLRFEAETAKTESQRETASEKHEVDFAISEQKLGKPIEEHQHEYE